MSTFKEKSFKVTAEKVIDELIKELLIEQKKLEKINDKVMKHEIIERLNIKELDSRIHDEIKLFEEINTKIKKLNKKIMKNMFWDETDETLEGLGRKKEAEKIESVHKIKAYRIGIKSIQQEAKTEREQLNIEKTYITLF